MTIASIVFDFDGTLVESIDTKTRAFRTLFSSEPDHVDCIVALHLEHGGRSRYEKFAMIYRDVLHRQPEEGEFEALGKRFEALVCDAVVACPFVPGAKEFIDEWSRRLPLIVVSGTPHGELVRIIERRGLSSLFCEVHGLPREKEEILPDVLRRRAWHPSNVLFVGDAMTDWRAAVHTKVPFVGRVPAGSANPFPAQVPTIADLSGLASLMRDATLC